MSRRRLQFFFFAALLFISPVRADPTVGRAYSVTMIDVDQNKFATADGHVTIIVMASSADVEKVRAVGDRVPEFCLANSEYRMITVLRFQKSYRAPMRMITNALIRRRLDAEAKRLHPRYVAKKITRNPRSDVFAVADFDGTVGSQLGIPPGSTEFQVLVLGRKGELLRRWTNVPTAEELAAVLK
jgi:hypothetical protein